MGSMEGLFCEENLQREHALAAGTIISKMVSSQFLGCECPADAALSSRQCWDLTGFIPQMIYSQGWNCPPVARTGVFGYLHPGTRGLLWGRFFHWFSRHWDASQEGTSRKLLFIYMFVWQDSSYVRLEPANPCTRGKRLTALNPRRPRWSKSWHLEEHPQGPR